MPHEDALTTDAGHNVDEPWSRISPSGTYDGFVAA